MIEDVIDWVEQVQSCEDCDLDGAICIEHMP